MDAPYPASTALGTSSIVESYLTPGEGNSFLQQKPLQFTKTPRWSNPVRSRILAFKILLSVCLLVMLTVVLVKFPVAGDRSWSARPLKREVDFLQDELSNMEHELSGLENGFKKESDLLQNTVALEDKRRIANDVIGYLPYRNLFNNWKKVG